MTEVHDSMPVILTNQQANTWLSPIELTEAQTNDILLPAPDNSLNLVKVSDKVNSVKNNYKELIYPMD
jgi:putative SOS response-associated peptidase YedK